MVILEQKFHTTTIIVIEKKVRVIPIVKGRKVRVMATSIGAKCKTENDGNNCRKKKKKKKRRQKMGEKKKKKKNYDCSVVDKNPKP